MLQLMMIYWGLVLVYMGGYGLMCIIERWWKK